MIKRYFHRYFYYVNVVKTLKIERDREIENAYFLDIKTENVIWVETI